VVIASDRIATKPLFLFNDGQALYFGPEMKSLLAVALPGRELDLAAVADFLTNGYLTCEHTLIKGFERMDGATVMEIKPGGITRHRYWEFDLERGEPDRGLKYYQATLAGLLRRAVQRRLRTDNTYGVLLSGGYDSRGILGCYLEVKSAQDLHTISWGREEELPNGDCLVAKRLAQKLGTRHRFYRLTAQDVFDRFDEFVLLSEGQVDFAESY
jgi:asparagine synthase (glutamine-hydrolysing)